MPIQGIQAMVWVATIPLAAHLGSMIHRNLGAYG